jgi:hypothetical protein
MYTVLGQTFSSFEDVVKFAEEEHGLVFSEPESILTEEEKDMAVLELEHFISEGE